MEKLQNFYLVEENESGEESYLMKNYSNSFIPTVSPENAFKFKTEEMAKKACTMQNMLAEVFGNNTKTYYIKQDITRTKYDQTGVLQDDKKGTEDDASNDKVALEDEVQVEAKG